MLNENHFLILMTVLYSKLTYAEHALKTTASHAALTLIDRWIMPYSITNFFLAENGLLFVSKFSNPLAGSSALKN